MLTKLFAALMTVIVCFGTAYVPSDTNQPLARRTEMTVINTKNPAQETAPAESKTAAETYLDASRAEDIALRALWFARDEVRFDRTEIDYERGKRVYEIEFWADETEYDFVIDAVTGEILRQKQETERRPVTPEPEISAPKPEPQPEPTEITQEQAIESALAHAGLTEEQVTRLHAKKDRDDGVWVYEIEFRNGRTEYEYEIRVSDGKIIDCDKDWDD